MKAFGESLREEILRSLKSDGLGFSKETRKELNVGLTVGHIRTKMKGWRKKRLAVAEKNRERLEGGTLEELKSTGQRRLSVSHDLTSELISVPPPPKPVADRNAASLLFPVSVHLVASPGPLPS
ncbi:Uncharacterized protein Fot_02220 [Forsythia ovata]|uniref:Clr5 domain-containing protein n=1 Tax=Forsythia ovata TaxID=205694 RepID=A0ABD1X6S9_9LAMI